MARRNWFTVDHDGLTAIAKRRGMAFIICEPLQNAWDEEGVTRAELTLTPVPNSPRVDLTVADDSPNGFRDLADSYRLFGESYKLANPEQRGRFNLGEKLLLAVAESARVTSTTGSVIFGPKGRTTGRKRTERGSVLTARLRMTRSEMDEAIDFAHTLIPPSGIETIVNGTTLPMRDPLRTAERSLETEIRGDEGGFRYTRRRATVSVYDALPGETSHLYEMGIPIDKLDCPWHVSIGQKVPLSTDRGSVRLGYVHRIQEAAAEIMAESIDQEQARAAWVAESLTTMEDDDAVRHVVRKRFGKAVTYDPSDPEANKRALDAGYHVVRGGELSKRAWQTVRRAKALEPAGRKFSRFVHRSPDGVAPEPRTAWTPEMERFAEYAYRLSEYIMGEPLAVNFYRLTGHPALGFCGSGEIGVNLSSGGTALVESMDQEKVDRFLIHELAHARGAGDHYTDRFHEECCWIGAKMRGFLDYLWECES